jgi:hypothetical protein
VTEPQHCPTCDTWGCEGIPPRRPEPVPPLTPTQVASEATRTAALAAIRAELAAARKRSQEKP